MGQPVSARSYAAVLADLDGTLVDSWPCLSRAWTGWAVAWGVTAEQFRAAAGSTTRDLVAALVPPDRFAEAFVDIETAEQADVDGCVPLPGAGSVLDLPPHRVAVVTSASREVARRRLAAAALPVPGVLVSADDVTCGKPSPEPYLLAAQRLGVPPADCLVLEDSRVGLAAARAAGMTVAVVASGPEQLREGGDLTLADLGSLSWRVDGAGVRLV